MTLIDYLVNQKLIKETVREVQENFKTALCGAIQNGSFQTHHKTKV